jgi:hypothetical protein
VHPFPNSQSKKTILQEQQDGVNMETFPLSGDPGKPTIKKGMARGKLWMIKIILLLLVVSLAIFDTRLAGSHLARSFALFRKPSHAYTAFTFGISFWGFLLGLPFSFIPFRRLAWKHRFILASLCMMLTLLLLYLSFFMFKMIRH